MLGEALSATFKVAISTIKSSSGDACCFVVVVVSILLYCLMVDKSWFWSLAWSRTEVEYNGWKTRQRRRKRKRVATIFVVLLLFDGGQKLVAFVGVVVH